MAVSVDVVYKTVLSILNKEQRGYMTPDEFNRIGNQVQMEIFESYFDDLNQQLRVQQSKTEYADRQKDVENKIAPFKTISVCSYNPLFDRFTTPTLVYRLGTVIYKDEIEVQRVNRDELLYLNLSKLTKPTEQFPVYLYEQSTPGNAGNFTSNPFIRIFPSSIKNNVTVTYIRRPANIVWDYRGLGGVPWVSGPYIYNPTTSVQFELDASEQTEIILRILAYAGVVIRDQEVVQTAMQKVQMDEINSKS